MAGGLELGDLKGHFQPQPFHDGNTGLNLALLSTATIGLRQTNLFSHFYHTETADTKAALKGTLGCEVKNLTHTYKDEFPNCYFCEIFFNKVKIF